MDLCLDFYVDIYKLIHISSVKIYKYSGIAFDESSLRRNYMRKVLTEIQ